jgi:formylglycine-generating enzyme required for sulfatase activity
MKIATRSRWLVATFAALLLCGAYRGPRAQDVTYPPQGQQIPTPACYYVPAWNTDRARLCTAGEVLAWRGDITHWRDEQRRRIGYDGTAYTDPRMQWTQRSFIQPQMMAHDRFFYDPVAGRYTVDRYLDDVDRRYGGIDSVLIWHTYPNLGSDDRNQFDLFRDLPGGLAGVREMVAAFHRRGVRVFFPLMIWDRGTRDEGLPEEQALVRELAAVDADGVNGDTLEGMPRSYFLAAQQAGHPLAFEPELGVSNDEMLAYNVMSWGEGWKSTFVPMVSRSKWLEPRHMVNLVNRWAHDRNDDLQIAFLNGIGYVSWENIWGIWNGITPHDGETLRRIGAIDRAAGDLLTGPDWEPLTPTLQFGVIASKWPGTGQTLWTLVNRNQYAVAGEQLAVPSRAGARYYDLWNGRELTPKFSGTGPATLSFSIEPDGFAAVIETTGPLSAPMQAIMTLAASKASAAATQWTYLPQSIIDALPKPEAASAMKRSSGTRSADDMVAIPAADFDFEVHGIETEGQDDAGVDVQYPWEDSPRRYHHHTVHIDAFSIDRYPVTNAEFKRFLDATGYHPADTHNFLHDWQDGSYPAGWEKKPVTWVSVEDAASYARWAGKRLPHEWEWQYAAQGSDGRVYPWGDAWVAADVPAPDRGRMLEPPANVDAHPAGASPFGVMDTTGNVWQWTDIFADDHTRAAILRGGSHYQPQGSRWYFPQAYRLDEHGKYLLMSPGMDRSGTVGFRCVRDGY